MTEETEYYMDCINPDCEFWHMLTYLNEMCPVCGSKLEPAQVEDWNLE